MVICAVGKIRTNWADDGSGKVQRSDQNCDVLQLLITFLMFNSVRFFLSFKVTEPGMGRPPPFPSFASFIPR